MRTDAGKVGGIIAVAAGVDLSPFIETAAELVTEVCTDKGYTATRLELIERWLSAHFYAIRNPQASSQKAGEVAEGFNFSLGLGLNQTTYGQQAMQLDTKGGLASLQKRTLDGLGGKASIISLGTGRDE